MFGLNKKELKILKKLDTPWKIQNFLNEMPMNFEENGDTCFSPMSVLEHNTCHCMEGAALAALALRINGHPPLIVDMKGTAGDCDHVIAVFKKYRKWGAISKTNHAVLRYREPVYNSIRELIMSYFHEYTDKIGRKTLRSFSNPVNLKIFDKRGWMNTKEEIDYIPEYIDEVKHFSILNRKQIQNLRKSDHVEIRMGNIVEWKEKRPKHKKIT